MATRLRDLLNLNLGNLNGSKNKNLIRYNATSQKFESISIDSLVGLSTNLPTSFVNVIESEINIDNVDVENYNGGTF